MKLRNLFSILLITACLMSISQSALADNNAQALNEPNSSDVGAGDSMKTAIEITEAEEYRIRATLDGIEDEDWYKWTNNTGGPKLMSSNIFNRGHNNVIVQSAIFQYDNEYNRSSMVYGENTTTNSISYLIGLYVPEGATVFIRVKAEQINWPPEYDLDFRAFDVDWQ